MQAVERELGEYANGNGHIRHTSNGHHFPTSLKEFGADLLKASPEDLIRSGLDFAIDINGAVTENSQLRSDPVWEGKGVPRGNGRTEILIPGFLASRFSFDVAMEPWLKRIGYETKHLPLLIGRNIEPIEDITERTLQQARKIHDRTGKKAGLIGWSRGGFAIWKALKFYPNQVEKDIDNIVILAAPPPKSINPNVGWPYYFVQRFFNTDDFRHLDKIGGDWNLPKLDRVKITLVVSETDGIIKRQDRPAQIGEYRLPKATHSGMAVNADVYRVVGNGLVNPISLSKAA